LFVTSFLNIQYRQNLKRRIKRAEADRFGKLIGF
jgi:hypothetical protein